jgi:O-antigen ligase
MAIASTSTAATYLRADSAGRGLWIIAGLALLAVAVACGYALALHEVEAVYLTLGVIASIAVLYDFRIGAVLLVLMLPIADSTVIPRQIMGITGLNSLNLLLAATLGSYMLRGRLHKAGVFMPRPLLWLYIVPIVVAGLIGMNYVDDILPYFMDMLVVHFTSEFGYIREMVVRPLISVLAAVLVAAAVARAQKPERFIIAIAISVWLVLLVQLGYVVISGVRLGWLASSRARTFFDAIGIHANDLGRIYMVAYALLLFVWWETKQQALKNFLFITMGVLCFGLLLTFSRGAFMGFMLIYLWLLAWKFNAKTASLAILVIVLAAFVMPNAVYYRISVGMDTGEADAVSAGRIEGIWLPLLPEVLKSPLWGHGLGSIMWSTPMLSGGMLTVGHAHNAYLEALLDMGLIGLGLLLVYFWHVWQGFRKLGSNSYLSAELRGFFQGATAALLAFLVTGMAGSSLRPTGEFAYLWLAIGVMYGVLARRPNP